MLEKTHSWRSTIKGLNGDVQRDWSELSDEVQSRLLGLRKDHWALLGRMRGSAKPIVFNRYGEKIQEAIQLVVAADDGDFPDVAIEAYASLWGLPDIGEGIASRLLALAKPDRFVSVNRKSRVGLAKCFGPDMPTALGVPKNYRKLLERIHRRTWFREPAPQDERGQDIWRMRAALLDCFRLRRHGRITTVHRLKHSRRYRPGNHPPPRCGIETPHQIHHSGLDTRTLVRAKHGANKA